MAVQCTAVSPSSRPACALCDSTERPQGRDLQNELEAEFTESIDAVFGLLGDLLRAYLVVVLDLHVKLVDGDHMLSSVVLKATCKEGLWEE